MSQAAAQIAENVAEIRDRIAAAARRSGRSADDVTLICVTKYAGLDEVQALLDAGCQHLGESRPQQLWQRAEALIDHSIHWHLIGHLQRNKVQRTVPLVELVHSADSIRLLATLNEAGQKQGRAVRVLLEVNISGDATKHGFAPDEVEPLLARLSDWPHVEARGLMAMARREGDLDSARQDFARLRKLRDRLQPVAPQAIELSELSMGMSLDYEVAIEEGATLVRIGSALFEGVGR